MALLKYSLLRLALLVVIAAILYRVGFRDLTLIVAAPLLALMISYVTLGGPRESAARALAERKATRRADGERFSRGVEDDAASEDATIDGAAGRPARQEPIPDEPVSDKLALGDAVQQQSASHGSDGEPESK